MADPLKWEFPGGKVEAGETPEQALRREVLEELDVEIQVGRHLERGEAGPPQRRIVLDVYLASRAGDGPIELREHRRLAWVDAAGLGDLDWAEPDLPAVRRLKAYLEAPASPARR